VRHITDLKVVIFSRRPFEGVVCCPTEDALHLKSKSANILKTYCTLTEGALHLNSKSALYSFVHRTMTTGCDVARSVGVNIFCLSKFD